MKDSPAVMTRIPGATYRLQFNLPFTFEVACTVVPYLSELGITDLYASPVFTSRPGSTHGYDIVDYNEINPEIGGEAGFGRLTEELRRSGLGLILDIVPNHMCIASDGNQWWTDVLENGPSSRFARFFDIDWRPVKKELKNKILIPTLGDQYGRVLENQEIRLGYDAGSFFVTCYGRIFPLRPRTYAAILKHRLELLKQTFSEGNYALSEFLSIITALDNLPSPLEKDLQKVAERYREKQIIRRRLHQLCSESAAIREYIEEMVSVFNGKGDDARSFDHLDRLLRNQVYRLAYWRVAAEEINYRRFFDINDLAAVRMEDPSVYEASHRLLFRLIRERNVTGLRVDHADGLYDPAEYLRWLQRDCYISLLQSHSEAVRNSLPEDVMNTVNSTAEGSQLFSGNDQTLLEHYQEAFAKDPVMKPFYLVTEKILIKGERIPEDWPVFSTTGYVFMNSVNGIFIDMRNEKAMNDLYVRFTRQGAPLPDVVYEKKKLVMQVSMASEINTLSHYLQQLSEKDRHTRDFTLGSLISAIVEVIAFFPVYRTYINSFLVTERDQRYIDIAVSKAKRNNPAVSASIFDFLRDVLLLKFPPSFTDLEKDEWLNFVGRFQQLSGPVMAKGLEDTAFYIYNRFLSLNEVGGAPERFGTPLETFHGQNIERIKYWPHALISTCTHDTKRGEDVRARMNVLSEIPDVWKSRVYEWSRINSRKKVLIDGRRVPDRNEEYLLYQTLTGSWPIGEFSGAAASDYRIRIREYLLKAVREAKVNSSWINQNATYEEGLMFFVEGILSPLPGNRFLEDFVPFAESVATFGMYNSLSQVLLKITSPGVPDFYQGTELWDLSLVDPDNRRPVDFSQRIGLLRALRELGAERGAGETCRELIADWRSGRIKLYLMHKALTFRKDHRRLFEQGEYIPLEVIGGREGHICSFVRRNGSDRVVVAVPRFPARLLGDPGNPLCGDAAWEDTAVVIPWAEKGARYLNIFTGEEAETGAFRGATVLPARDLFSDFPVALLKRIH